MNIRSLVVGTFICLSCIIVMIDDSCYIHLSFPMRYLAGKKVASRKEELRELIEHFNVSVLLKITVFSQETRTVIITFCTYVFSNIQDSC